MNLNKSKWPVPKHKEKSQPHFLFIITPPFSGSTAISQIINTSHRTMFLQPRGEGQWLIPGLCEKDRWSPDKKVNYTSIKSVWLKRFQLVNSLTQNIDVVIEKSPPNMMRLEKISSQFDEFSYLANNRNPYANCASILYRNNDAENLSPTQRKLILERLARDWQIRSNIIKGLILKLKIPMITYECFCENPLSILNKLNLPDGVIETINFQTKVKVKDYKIQTISNQNNRQISNLTPDEIDSVSQVLRNSKDLLKFFEYQLK